jgi:hypothetical protein
MLLQTLRCVQRQPRGYTQRHKRPTTAEGANRDVILGPDFSQAPSDAPIARWTCTYLSRRRDVTPGTDANATLVY